MLVGRVFGRGEYNRKTTPECWIDGRRMRAAPKGRHSGRGYAVETRAIGGVFMKSLIFKRSIMVAGHKTSVSLEDAFWNGLKDRTGAAHEVVGVSRRNRRSAATRQSVVGPSTFRARFLSRPTFRRKGRARPNSRDDRLHCDRFFLSLCGRPRSRLSIVRRCIRCVRKCTLGI